MKRTINVYVKRENGYVAESVQGYPVALPGFEEFDFVCHRDTHYGNSWVISEATTGRCVMLGYAKTRQQASKMTLDGFERCGRTPENIRDAIRGESV